MGPMVLSFSVLSPSPLCFLGKFNSFFQVWEGPGRPFAFWFHLFHWSLLTSNQCYLFPCRNTCPPYSHNPSAQNPYGIFISQYPHSLLSDGFLKASLMPHCISLSGQWGPCAASPVGWVSALSSPGTSFHQHIPSLSPDVIPGHEEGLPWARVKFIVLTGEGLHQTQGPWFLILPCPLDWDVHSSQRVEPRTSAGPWSQEQERLFQCPVGCSCWFFLSCYRLSIRRWLIIVDLWRI